MKKAASSFDRHDSINHSIGEYVRGDVHTNTIEGYFSIMKRGVHGVYHHVSQQHLKRYLAEFDFRYNERSALGVEDTERMTRSVKGIIGSASLIVRRLIGKETQVLERTEELWRRRLYLPNYQIGEAARYAEYFAADRRRLASNRKSVGLSKGAASGIVVFAIDRSCCGGGFSQGRHSLA
jgi:ISXO2-like transposase domain